VKLYHVTGGWMGVLTHLQFFFGGGHRPLTIWEDKKQKIWCDLEQLSTLSAEISGTDGAIDKQ